MRSRSPWLKAGGVTVVALVVTALFSTTVRTQPEGHEFSGFMEDYSIMVPPSDATGPDLVYRPAGQDRIADKYTKIMIDQPELFLAPDSPYKGMKPDQSKALADGFRGMLTDTFGKHFQVVDEPGDDVLYMRLGLTGLYLKRKVKWYNYTPIGAVALGTKTAFVDSVAKKFSLIEVAVEAELYDSQTQELLGAGIDFMGQAKDEKAGIKKDPTSWKELEALLSVLGDRMDCRLENLKNTEALQKDCWAIEDKKKK